MDGDKVTDEAFEAFVASVPNCSVLDAEQDRIAKGYPADEALLDHGDAIEDEITRTLMQEAKALEAAKRPAVLLAFPVNPKRDDA